MSENATKLVEVLRSVKEQLSDIDLVREPDVSSISFKIDLKTAFGVIIDCSDQLLELRSGFRGAGLSRRSKRDLQVLHTGDYNYLGALPYVELRLRYLNTDADQETKARWLTELKNGIHTTCDRLSELIENINRELDEES